MPTVLFCIPLKENSLAQYETFAKEHVQQDKEYREMLTRYDIHSAKVWHQNINNRDYVFVYHEVGPNFTEKMKGWDTSTHPFDKWFRDNMMAVYDIDSAASMQSPRIVFDFK
ncbi:MAG: hypothetical protein ACK4PR_03925 [Gammaproteobacteria bacterium]